MWNRAENQITLVMLRHGTTKANKERRYLGRTDEVLSEEGEKELLECRKFGGYPEIDYLFTSPMKRCIQTAEILYPGLQAVIVPEWTEMDFGLFEGKNYMELKDDEQYRGWLDSNGTFPFPNGENREEFILRCESGFQRMIKELKQLTEDNAQKTIGMIVHGGTIMALLSRYCGGDYFDYQVPNGKGFICTLKDRNTFGDKYEYCIKLQDLRKVW